METHSSPSPLSSVPRHSALKSVERSEIPTGRDTLHPALAFTLFFASLLFLSLAPRAQAEAMLELFNMSWSQVTQKMPEIAEAGYDSLWLPNPAKGTSGGFSIGYDQFDPFDLGDKNQQGTVATLYGTKAQLLQMVQTAHRFGIRVYFDNVMNHRGPNVPGYDSNTPTNYYPGLVPQDFHLQTTSSGYRDWNNIDNFCDQWTVQNRPLLGLVDLAQEPGAINNNFGSSLGNVAAKPVFIRHPNNPDYYMDTTTPSLGGPWHGFNGTNGQPVAEDVTAYLIRAAMWTLYTTKCDGFRLDAVKHAPSNFFGTNSANTFSDESSFYGYTGGIQAMYDWVHGYGNNVTGNGYVETDGNRNSLFDTEAPRNDAMLFGEHVSPVPDFQQYLNVGMRLCNQPLYNEMNNVLNGADGFDNNGGMDGRDYTPPPDYCNGTPYPCYSAAQSVMFPQTQDGGSCCPTRQEMQDAYYFMHEGLPMIYSDGYNHSGPPNYFPIVSYANYLGEFSDNRMPEIAYLHNQLSRGGTRSRWHDHNIVAWERYDYRDVPNNNGQAYTNADATVVFFAMNDNFGNPGDVMFDDGVSRAPDGYYGCANGSPSRGIAMIVGFPPGSILSQMASTSTSSNRACTKLLVHGATTSLAQAQATANDPTPQNRLLLVNTTPPPGGGAIELVIPSGGWVMYAYQWPEASRANVLSNAITFRQGGSPVATFTAYRHDGVNGDANFNPVYPFKMRGSFDPNGNVVGGQNVSNLTYAIDIPVITNASFDALLRCDASAASIQAKLDGGMDINSQMGIAPLTGLDRRDNRPGVVSDVFLGYEQTIQQFRYGPEKFAARLVARNNVTSLGAETYYFTIGSTNQVILGSGNGANINTFTANWVYHDPVAPVTIIPPTGPPTQMYPTNPAPGQSVDIWVKVGNNFQTNQCFIYYTTDGSNPEGAFGVGKGTTQVIHAAWASHDSSDSTIDWFKGTIPGQINGTQVRYKVALFQQGIPTISDSDNSKLYGLSQFGITNFDPTSVTVWTHNDLNTNNTQLGLTSGFHILRARCFLPRSGKSGVYNTFSQTFYYDGALPTGVIAFPQTNSTISNSIYQVVIRADSSVTGVDFNLQDSDPSNDDVITGQANGNGNTNGLPIFVSASSVNPDATLSQQYPNYPNEFRFNYVAVPTNGTATISVRLKTFGTSVYPNRFTLLTNIVNTLAPPNTLYFANPPYDGFPLVLSSNSAYILQACFTPTLDTNVVSMFSLYINGVLQPTNAYNLRPPGAVAGCPGLRSFLYSWTNAASGPAVFQLNFTNAGISLNATRTVPVGIIDSPVDSDGDGMPDWMELLAGTDPYNANSVFRIKGLGWGNPVEVSWSSVSNKAYQVLSTTNLTIPMSVDPNGTSIPASTSGSSTQWFDPASDATNKFYRIKLLQ